jgi:hypothetical protein
MPKINRWRFIYDEMKIVQLLKNVDYKTSESPESSYRRMGHT